VTRLAGTVTPAAGLSTPASDGGDRSTAEIAQPVDLSQNGGSLPFKGDKGIHDSRHLFS
jgi:hypothetical protein